MSTYAQVMKTLEAGDWRPVYFLQGEEPYYIQQISQYIATHALTEAERSFNQSVFYGRDVDVQSLLDSLRRLPMMASHQVVILREAQAMRDFAKKMEPYFLKPVPTTIFVVQYMGKKLRSNAKALKSITQHKGIVFTSDKIRDYKLVDWIQSYAQSQGKKLDHKAAHLLAEYLGTDLSQIVHSLEKLQVNDVGNIITAADIETYVGISKDYNVFELSNALLAKDSDKAFRIVDYFAANPKGCPFPVLLGSLYGLFSRLLLMHGLPTNDQGTLVAKLKISPFFVKDYLHARQAYPVSELRRIVGVLSEFDLRFKGVNNVDNNEGRLMQEMIAKIVL